MSEVVFRSVSKQFGATRALQDLDLEVTSGELVCLLGPSGCGKTTALRILAGFERPDSGDVLVGGRSVLDTDARYRGFGMVFQSYSLFPNMTARRNISFALSLKGERGGSADRRVDELLAVTGLSDHAGKFPHQLSGGQQQRVALARAIATRPPVLLLDEPLSALDASVREQLRDEIRRLQQELGITTLFVTHDQHEAMAIADRIGVMTSGRLVQLGPPAEVYERPADTFVSGFLGTSNLLRASAGSNGVAQVLGQVVAGVGPGGQVAVRPEHIALDRGVDGPGAAATVVSVSFLGPLTRVACRLGPPSVDGSADGGPVLVDLPSRAASGLRSGDRVRLRLDGPATMAG